MLRQQNLCLQGGAGSIFKGAIATGKLCGQEYDEGLPWKVSYNV